MTKYFEEGKHLAALQFNRYLVVHLDTDIAADLGVARVRDGRPLTDTETVDAFIERIRSIVGESFWVDHGHRLIFAIGIEAIECWLLPLVFDRSEKKRRVKTTGCLEAIDHQRRLAKRPTLTRPTGKDPKVYREISAALRKRSDVEAAAGFNAGFAHFVARLASLGALDRG